MPASRLIAAVSAGTVVLSSVLVVSGSATAEGVAVGSDARLTAARASAGVAMSPKRIKALTAKAYTWGLAPEFVRRFAKYNSLINAPINHLKYGSTPAGWNTSGTNAGDASVLYLNSFVDFTKTDAMVLSVPPSRKQYYVVNYLDNFINTVGSVGTRTTPSGRMTSYLLVGPESKYAGRRHVTIKGFRYRVMASDTNLNWMLIRIRADSLVDASDPSSTASVFQDVNKKFALNRLSTFAKNGNAPVYPKRFVTSPSQQQIKRAGKYKNTPTSAVRFMKQLGSSLVKSPLPTRNTGQTGTPLRALPAWVTPQYHVKKIYRVPSFPQKSTLARFAPIGLTADGFTVPSQWGKRQLRALQVGFEKGATLVQKASDLGTPSAANNYWTFDNSMIGTYPNTKPGYLVRASVVINGGSANLPPDAVYPVVNTLNGTTALDGNNTYSLTFTPPGEDYGQYPVYGTIPPLVLNSAGDPKGFWSLTLYQPDSTEVSAPFLPQSAVLNTSYSTTQTPVTSVNAAADTVTVPAPGWGPLEASSAVLFGSSAADYGLIPGDVYYLTSAPTTQGKGSNKTYTFSVSQEWLQDISSGDVPIQNSGQPGATVDLQAPAGADPLTMGMVQPVSQLGSQQITSGSLAANPDDSYTIWLGPTLPPGVPASNWLPTPSTAYYESLYPGQDINTTIRPMLRMYYPTPGDDPPSILPYGSGDTKLTSSWIPPLLQQVSP